MRTSNTPNAITALGLCSFLLYNSNFISLVSSFAPQHAVVLRDQPRTYPTTPNCEGRPTSSATSIGMGESTSDDGEKNPSPLSSETQTRKSRLVWLTGHEDLRLHDHGGFSAALAEAVGNNDIDALIIPVFVIDPDTHLRSKSKSSLTRLHGSLTALEKEISSLSMPYLSDLVVKIGSPSSVLPELVRDVDAIACHVVDDDVVNNMRLLQRSACAALDEMGIEILRWSNRLRPSAPWASEKDTLPSFFPEYCDIADPLPIPAPENNPILTQIQTTSQVEMMVRSEGIPSLDELVEMAASVTPNSVLEARSVRKYADTTEPFEALISEKWSTEKGAQKALKEYCSIGKDEFTNKYFIASDAANKGTSNGKSMYASSIARILRSSPSPTEAFALREGPSRAFSSALGLGALSARDVVDAARNRSPRTPPLFFWEAGVKEMDNVNRAGLFPSDNTFWGRSSEGSLSDVIEWREWFHLLAERSLALQEKNEPGTSGGEKLNMTNENNKDKDGDPRESGTINYWRWKDQHLVRYLTFPAGKDYEEQDEESRDPAILLVHGFAASAEQWERLVYRMREQRIKANGGKDTTPPIYAVDLLGFGHSEKPGISYTQYLWESQLIDFAVEVMEAVPMVMVGNSIGGGLSAGAAASLGKKICKGLVLLNTAGLLIEPDEYEGFKIDAETKIEIDSSIDSHTDAAMAGNPEKIYQTVPVLGNSFLDVFGWGIVKLIYPQIEDRLSLIYGNRIENADPSVVYAIQQSASSPGSANVIGSGQKLAPNRPLNEVLMGVGEEESFPTLVVIGLDDRVSSPKVAEVRADLFSRLNSDTVTLKKLHDAGHCPHDEVPDKVADAMLKWLDAHSLQGKRSMLDVNEENLICSTSSQTESR